MKTLQGTIVSISDAKTVKVNVVRQWQHPLYLKSVTRSKDYACHVDGVEVAVGDAVVIQECRPMSKTKHFVVVSKTGAQA